MTVISLNGERREIDNTRSLAELLAGWDYAAERVAVARNDEFVPRSEYAHTRLQGGDRIDVVAPVQGG